ncbi:ORC-CDC6 family AAA ATPase [Sphingomonas sp. GB1N7]|uniref:ORC-CDC6 family AAA ATPase n=1 Tax=Parasphingomonas caseinilytica TaxID=3096158 RepID=UPI002FCA4B2C
MVRNAFAVRTSELSSTDELFARDFAPEVLEIMPRDLFATSAMVLRSSPGGGKTSLLRIFTPGPMLQVHRNAQRQPYDEIYRQLHAIGAIDGNGVRAMGILIPCTNGYSELQPPEQDPTARGMFRALVNARIVLRTLRSICMLNGLSYQTDLSRVELDYDLSLLDAGIIPRGSGTQGLRAWAEAVETRLLTVLDQIDMPDRDTPVHLSFDAVTWLSQVRFSIGGRVCDVRPIVMFDDVQRLRPGQRAMLYRELLDHRSSAPVWLAERTAVLESAEIFSDAIQSRDFEVVQIERGWQALSDRRFIAFVTGIADRRMRQMRDDPEGFGDHLGSTLDPLAFEGRLATAVSTLRDRAHHLGRSSDRYATWIAAAEQTTALDLLAQALEWSKTNILIARDQNRIQATLDLEPLPMEERENRETSKLPQAALKFISSEFGLPYFYGIDRVVRLSSYNVEEFLQICAVLYEHLHAARVARGEGPITVTPFDQDRALRKLAEKRFREISRAFPMGAKAQRVITAIGKLAHEQTFAPNAPYAPGVTGIGITPVDREALIRASGDPRNPYQETARILSACIAQNLFEVRELRQDGKMWTVLYLNRLLCAHFDLVYHTGGWRPTSIARLRAWHQTSATPTIL